MFHLTNRIALAAVMCSACAVSASERQREGTEWASMYWYEANQTRLPRILLVGDSICRGYESLVRKELQGKAYTSYYATSKCVTDRSYLKELGYVLDEYEYAVIHFNNGLHSLGTDRTAWEERLRDAVALIREKAPKASVVWATSTPLKDPGLTAKAKELNAIAVRVMADNDIPTNDLFALMDPQDRNKLWTDTFHYNGTGKTMQAKQVADVILRRLPAVPPASPVNNADFEKEGAWLLYPPKPEVGTLTITEDELRPGNRAASVVVTGDGYEVQLYQHRPALAAGRTYRLSYRARADHACKMKSNIRTQKPPYVYHGQHESKLSTEWQTFTTDVQIPDDFDPGKYVLFFCFGGKGTYWLDDVAIRSAETK